MTAKGRNLYLYLSLLCFFGIIAIFIVDGYMVSIVLGAALIVIGAPIQRRLSAERS